MSRVSRWAPPIVRRSTIPNFVHAEPVVPEYEFLINGEALSVRKDFAPEAVSNTVTLTTEQLNSFEWTNAEEGVSIMVNGIALENGKCDFALAKLDETEKIRVQFPQGGAWARSSTLPRNAFSRNPARVSLRVCKRNSIAA